VLLLLLLLLSSRRYSEIDGGEGTKVLMIEKNRSNTSII